MKTISVNIYSFNELSKEAKQKAISDYRDCKDTSYIYNDAHKTVKKFNDIFNTKEGGHSWLEINCYIDDNILNLSGLRLRTYIINNYGDALFKNKYIKRIKGKSVYSKIKKDNCCVLTGVCYDDDILSPIYKFLEQKSFDCTTFEDLLKKCFINLKCVLDDEEEYMRSDEYITESILANEYEFYENGKLV